MKKKRAHGTTLTSNTYSTSSSDSFSVEEIKKVRPTKWPPISKPRQRNKKFSKHLHQKSKRRAVDFRVISSETSSSSNSSNTKEHGNGSGSRCENIQDEGSGQSFSVSNTNSSSTATGTTPPPRLSHAHYKNHRDFKSKGKIKLNQRQKIKEKNDGTRTHHQYYGQEHNLYGKRMVKKSWIFQPCCCTEYNLWSWCVTIAMLEISVPLTIILSNLVQFDNLAFMFGRWSDDYYKHQTVISNLHYVEQAYFWFFFVVMVLCIFCGSIQMIAVYWKSNVFCLAHTVFALIISLKFAGLLLLGILLCNKDHFLAVISTCGLYAISSGFFVYFSLCSLGLFTQFRAGLGSRTGFGKSTTGASSLSHLNHPHSHGDLISNTITPLDGDAIDRHILHQDKNFVLSFLKYGIHS